MRNVALVLVGLSIVFYGCNHHDHASWATGNHPANPEAPAALESPPSVTLAIEADNLPKMPEEFDGDPSTGHGSHGATAGSQTTAPAEHADHAAAPAPSLEAKTTYTCPMHPEVVSGQPGKCPKCGMALVPKESKKP